MKARSATTEPLPILDTRRRSVLSSSLFMEQSSAPAPSENSLIKERKDKLAKLRDKGIDPFKNKFTPDSTCDSARSKFDKGEVPEGTRYSVAGRITAHRDMGKSIFIDVRDQSGRVQVYAQKQALGDEQFDIFKHLDLGDFIGVTGTMFRTKTNEPSLKLEAFTILAKALRPPPAKWHGLEDTEIRYRQRYLDLMGNPEVKKVFLQRSAIVHEIRAFFHSRGYVEVETPAMQPIPGGAAAAPFKTFHNALGCEFYLRIALELYHKRLLVGGIDKLFEIGKNFRNEGLSRRHNPEFTMLEAYQAFGDYETMMETVESLITTVAQKVLGTLQIEHDRRASFQALLNNFMRELVNFATASSKLAFEKGKQPILEELIQVRSWLEHLINEAATTTSVASLAVAAANWLEEEERAKRFALLDSFHDEAVGGVLIDDSVSKLFSRIKVVCDTFLARLSEFKEPKTINLSRPWKRARYKDLIKEKAGADWFDISSAERRQRAHDLGAEIGKEYEDFEVTGAVFEKLIEPTLIQPTFVTHLPKELVPLAKLSPDDPTTVEVFECCINGQEISPGYTEQNDPIAQRNTLEHQAGGEQQKLDEDFLVALEHGMPPAGGIGIGIDRLCMMLLGQESIRDVILFPQLKPKS
jgi:lysyl-tRNA synthetase